MEKCRSFYLDCKQHDFGEPTEEASWLDFTDIPFIDPANDNEPTIVPLSVRRRALLPSRSLNQPDSSTRYFVEKAVEVARDFPEYFSEDNVADCFYLLDDFHSSGRISGKQRIPLSRVRRAVLCGLGLDRVELK